MPDRRELVIQNRLVALNFTDCHEVVVGVVHIPHAVDQDTVRFKDLLRIRNPGQRDGAAVALTLRERHDLTAGVEVCLADAFVVGVRDVEVRRSVDSHAFGKVQRRCGGVPIRTVSSRDPGADDGADEARSRNDLSA